VSVSGGIVLDLRRNSVAVTGGCPRTNANETEMRRLGAGCAGTDRPRARYRTRWTLALKPVGVVASAITSVLVSADSAGCQRPGSEAGDGAVICWFRSISLVSAWMSRASSRRV
jgi:hypothetical protein